MSANGISGVSADRAGSVFARLGACVASAVLAALVALALTPGHAAGVELVTQTIGIGEDYTTIHVSRDDIARLGFWRAAQNALDEARETATDDRPCHVVIPAGNYDLDGGSLQIYSNTVLDCRGSGANTETLSDDANDVRIHAGKSNGTMLRSGRKDNQYISDPGGYDDYQHVQVLGGTWSGKSIDGKLVSGCNIRFGHSSDVKLLGMKVMDNSDTHHVELGAVDGCEIRGCTFSGAHGAGSLEAVQLDITHRHNSNFSSYYPYDDLPAINITVTGCTFKNVHRGIGSHHIILGAPFENITITNNVFQNIDDRAVCADYFSNSVISNNTMTNVNTGVFIASIVTSTSTRGQTYLKNSVKTGAVETHVANLEVSNNDITLNPTKAPWTGITTKYGIRVCGGKVDSTNCTYTETIVTGADYSEKSVTKSLAKGAYYQSGVSILNNNIHIHGSLGSSKGNINEGIRAAYAKNCTIMGNTIDLGGADKEGTGRGILLVNSIGVTVKSNTVKNVTRNNGSGIDVRESSSGNTVSDNTVSNVGAYGIVLRNSKGTTVTSNKLSGVANDGVYMASATASELKFNVVTSAKRTGIFVGSGSTVTGLVSNNQITAGASSGIMVNESKVGQIASNTVKNAQKNGIIVIGKGNASATAITGNTIVGATNAHYGINISGGKATSIVSNNISGKNTSGVYVHAYSGKKSTVTEIASNTIKGTSGDAIMVSGSKVTKQIAKNAIQSCNKGGVNVFSSATVANINSNTVSSCVGTGVTVLGKSEVTGAIADNVINGKSVKNYGIRIVGSNVSSLTKNTVRGRFAIGIYIKKDGGKMSLVKNVNSNEIYSAAKDGIHTSSSNVNNMKGNYISSSKRFAINVNSKSKVARASKNRLVKNGKRNVPYVDGTSIARFL